MSDNKSFKQHAHTLLKVSLCFVLLLFSGCVDEELPYVERPVEELYQEAYFALQNRDFSLSGALFEEVERQHAYSIWARRAQIMAAYAYYQSYEYDKSLSALDRFIQLHPGDQNISYAYYLRAICHYEQISDVQRDQAQTLLAHQALEEVIRRFPDTDYAKDAGLKLILTTDHLAGKEMEVGRFYLTRKFYQAGINRFNRVIENYQTSSHVPEALHRLTEAYFALGLYEEALKYAAVLGYNYSSSVWYQESYDLISTHQEE